MTARLRRAGALRRLLATLVVLASLTAVPALTAAPAQASTAHAMTWGGSRAGNAALDWATAHTYRHAYVYGAAGPYSYDCSGLVMAAFSHAGISLPHSTYSMLGNRHLHRVYSPQRGDLAFFGTGHVELVSAWWHTTYGAHNSRLLVGWRSWNSYWAPTAFYRVY